MTKNLRIEKNDLLETGPDGRAIVYLGDKELCEAMSLLNARSMRPKRNHYRD